MPRIHEHGTNQRYVLDRCRCTECRAAHAANAARRRRLIAYGQWQPMLPIDGVRRRLRALRRIGYPVRYLANELDMHPRWVAGLCLDWQKRVTPAVHGRIDALYQKLSETPGPNDRARKQAEKQGFHGPLAWDETTIDDPNATPFQHCVHDEVSDLLDTQVRVDRAVRGELPYAQLTQTERRMAVRRLNRAGLNDAEMARVLQSTTDTVGRRRMRMRLPSNFLPTSNYTRSA